MSGEAAIFSALFIKDLRTLWRRSSQLVATFGFAVLAVIVASFAFRQIGYSQQDLLEVTPGIIWLVFLFAGVIALNYSFLPEYEDRALEGMLRASGAPATVYLAKWASNYVFVAGVAFAVLASHALFFGADLSLSFAQIAVVALLAAVGFVALGTLLAAVAALHRERELILPLVLFPLLIPLLAGAVFVTRELLTAGTIAVGGFWFVLICVFDLISLVVSTILFEHVIAS